MVYVSTVKSSTRVTHMDELIITTTQTGICANGADLADLKPKKQQFKYRKRNENHALHSISLKRSLANNLLQMKQIANRKQNNNNKKNQNEELRKLNLKQTIRLYTGFCSKFYIKTQIDTLGKFSIAQNLYCHT